MNRIIITTLALAGCASVTPPPGLPDSKCSTQKLDILIGQPATDALTERARRRAGASIARILRPGQPVTLEYRQGRLNVNVDEQGRVVRFTCG